MAHLARMPLSLVDSRLPEIARSKRRRLAPAPTTPSPLPTTVAELLHYVGMAFEPSPPLPLRISGFQFLKSLDLSSVGINLKEIPVAFGWDLVEFRPSPVEVVSDLHSGVETGWDKEHSDLPLPNFDLNEPHPGPDPVRQHGCFDQPFWGDDSPNSDESIPTTIPPFTESLALEVPFNPTPIAISPPSPTTSPLRPATKPRAKPKARPSPKTTPQPTPRPTRKSSRLASPSRSRSFKRSSTPINLSDSSSDTFTIREEWTTPEASLDSTSSSPSSPPPTGPTRKRKATPNQGSPQGPVREATTAPKPKRAKTSTASAAKLKKFLQRSVVKGKIVKVTYFLEQGLGVFVDKLRAQHWLDLFGDATVGCSNPDLAEFYANCSVNQGVVTSEVGGKQICFDAIRLGKILGVPSVGCSAYIREDKSVLDQAELLALARRLGQQPDLAQPKSLKKREMAPLHQLLFWFVIKTIIPRGQGRNLADAMDQHLVDLLDRGVPINLPAIMIRHIHRITTSSRDHDLGFGFFLTLVLEEFGVPLQRRFGAQTVDMIGSTTLKGCGFACGPGGAAVPETGTSSPFPSVSGTSSGAPPLDILQELTRQKAEIAQVKTALDEERALHAKRHEDLLSLFSNLAAKLSNLPSPPP